jgi:hypothetical protein
MCAVSNVGDQWSKKFNDPNRWNHDVFTDPARITKPNQLPKLPLFDAAIAYAELKKEVEQMKRELEAAKKQDIVDGNPDCEMEEKVELLKGIAKLVGVDLSIVFGDKA